MIDAIDFYTKDRKENCLCVKKSNFKITLSHSYRTSWTYRPF